MKCALIVPDNRYYADVTGGTSLFPANLVYLIAHLNIKIEVKVFDRTLFENEGHFSESLADFDPDVVGLSCQYPAFNDMMLTANSVRVAVPHACIIIGGPAVHRSPKLFLKHLKADYANLGFGPHVLNLVAKAIEEGGDIHNVPGLYYLGKNLDRKTVSIAIPKNIDFQRMPELVYSSFNMDKYLPVCAFPIIWNWGCPFACNNKCWYCDNSYQWRKNEPRYRQRGLKCLRAELKFLLTKGIRTVTFLDATFTLPVTKPGPNVYQTLADLCITWQCQTRADLMQDINFCHYLRQSGCQLIWLGGDEAIYGAPQAKCTQEQLYIAIRNCCEVGIQVAVCALLGLTDQTYQSLLEIQRFFKRLQNENLPIMICSNRYVPYPGTVEYRKAVATGKLTGTEEETLRHLLGLNFDYYRGTRTRLVANVSQCTDDEIASCIKWIQQHNKNRINDSS